ncbi:MAG: hypothetical protein AAB915_00170, partial [Patescibacteria group bacterium]
MSTVSSSVKVYIEKLQALFNTPLTEEFKTALGQYRAKGRIDCRFTMKGYYDGLTYSFEVSPPDIPCSVVAFKIFNHIIRGTAEEITEEDLKQDETRERMLQDQISYVKTLMRQFEQDEGVVVDKFHPYENNF